MRLMCPNWYGLSTSHGTIGKEPASVFLVTAPAHGATDASSDPASNSAPFQRLPTNATPASRSRQPMQRFRSKGTCLKPKAPK